MYCLTAEAVSYICPVVYTTGWGTRVGAVVLDRQSVVPLYYQIQQGLSEQIRSGELKPGALMPSEQEIAARLCPDLLENFEPSGSLYRALAEQYGLQVHMADEVAEASVATAVEAKLLRVREKSPVFRFTRTAYLHNEQPIEFVKSIYRGDRCRVVNRLTRQLEIVRSGHHV